MPSLKPIMRLRQPLSRSLFFLFLLACLLTGLVGVVDNSVPVKAAPNQANQLDVVINEVAWAGTAQSQFDEWMELYSPSNTPIDLTGWRIEAKDGIPSISLSGTIGGATPDNHYLLLERASQNDVKDVVGIVYPGSSGLLDDNGETLYLLDDSSNIIDTVGTTNGKWAAGLASPPESMERLRTDIIGTSSYWGTNDGSIISNGLDAGDNNIHGTPGQPNWVTTITVTTLSDSPDPSDIGQDVTLSVVVDGVLPLPEGDVTVTDGTNTLCTITLSAGIGSCVTNFASDGNRNLIANYVPAPSDMHSASSDTEMHAVLYTTTTTITAISPSTGIANQNISVSVKVVGNGPTKPTGKVNITGANTNCIITINSSTGTGSCIVKFTSDGTKTLTATYQGDTLNNMSVGTKNLQVLLPTATPIKTPTKIPTRTSTPLPPPPPPLIAINEFVPRPGHDWNNDGVVNTGDEYIELLNHGVIDVNLSGYKLDDEANVGSPLFSLPSVTLKPGERIVFYGKETGLLLGDGGDGVRLLKSNGQLVDAYNYSVVDFPDQSYCRLPDDGGLDDWNTHCYPTPGLKNSLSGTILRPPTQNDEDNPLCPIADTLPQEFVLAECSPFGNNIWSRYYWDKFGWYGDKPLLNVNGKWDIYAD